MSENNMTKKQQNQVNKRIKHHGLEKVANYIKHFYPDADMNNLSKIQAQKIITGLKIPGPIIRNVYGRDIFH